MLLTYALHFNLAEMKRLMTVVSTVPLCGAKKYIVTIHIAT